MALLERLTATARNIDRMKASWALATERGTGWRPASQAWWRLKKRRLLRAEEP